MNRNPDVCPRGFDPIYFRDHPMRLDPGVNTEYESKPIPVGHSALYVLSLFEQMDRQGIDELSYAELVEISGLHEARLTSALSALRYAKRIIGPGVIFADAFGKAGKERRDRIIHVFSLAKYECERTSLGVIDRYIAAGKIQRVVSRSGIPENVRDAVWKKTNGFCWYCGYSVSHPSTRIHGLHIDHVIPRARGGSDDASNLVPACAFCNLSKGDKDVEEFRTAFRQRWGDDQFYFERLGL